MQGLYLFIQMGQTLLNGFGLSSMYQGYIGAILFLSIVGYAWNKVAGNKV